MHFHTIQKSPTDGWMDGVIYASLVVLTVNEWTCCI